MKKKRAQAIEKIMRLAWDSLQSHLRYTYEKDGNWNGQGFHRKCVKEYLEMMNEVVKLF